MKAVIVIPTYNEKDNIAALLEAIRLLKRSELSVLVVDDSSPDGTAQIVQHEAKKTDLPIHLLLRHKKEGLGKAYAAGFKWALERDYTHVISMDADFSHRPEDIPKLLDAKEADVVIGSRYVPGGAIEGWDIKRHVNSRLANIVTRFMLGLPPKDVTAGFKRYRRRFLESLDYHHIISSGYAFQVEMIFRAIKYGYSVLEVPIIFIDRTKGESKISGELRRSARIVWQLFLRRKGVRQFMRFVLVGGFGAIIDWTLFALLRAPLIQYGQAGRQLAKGGSFVVSSAINYGLNRTWTFRATEARIMHQAAKFYVVATIGLLANNLIFYVVTAEQLLGLPDIYGLVIATGGVAIWNFWASKRWTFR